MAENTLYKRSGSAKNQETQAGDSLQLKFGGNSVDVKTKILVGRGAECDVVLKDSLVSRKHCVIELVGETHYIRDLNSTNNTYVNKNPLTKGKPQRLHRGDVINVGKTEFTIQ